MQEKWLEIKVGLSPRHLETIASYLFALGSDGLVERETDFSVYFPESVWNSETLAMLKSICTSIDPKARLCVSQIETENWIENWKENFRPLKLTDSCCIVPDWEKDFDSGAAHKIIISPKMAFGTGHHETTQLLLMLLPDYLKPDMSVMDAGTGSGILAVHAVQLGASHVLAFDNDPVAIENALENVQLNQMENKIEAVVADLQQFKGTKFDLILANINRNVLLGFADEFSSSLYPGGILLLSGLLKTDYEAISKVYAEAGWTEIGQQQRGEWLALGYRRR